MFAGACGAIWLVLIAASVFAATALVRLGSGRPSGGETQSSWLLYTIIAISAVVILAAIPLLLRARRAALADSAPDSGAPEADALGASAVPAAVQQAAEAPTEKVRVFGVDPYARRVAAEPPARPAAAIIDRLWLRGTLALLGAIGLALTAVAVGTYLLADVGETGAWISFGVAGAITVAMPAVLAYFQRQVVEAAEEAVEVVVE